MHIWIDQNHVRPVSQAHYCEVHALQAILLAIILMNPLVELDRVVSRIAFTIGGNHHDDSFVLYKDVRVKVLEKHKLALKGGLTLTEVGIDSS